MKPFSRPCRVGSLTAACWMALAPVAAHAVPLEMENEAAVEQTESGGIVDRYSRFMFDFNLMIYDGFDQFNGWVSGDPAERSAPPKPDPAAGAVGNVVANLINEPLTALTSAAVGEFGNAWHSVERFGINSTVGILGYYDTASQWGYAPRHTDVGLSLCRAGVGEGGYVVLPFIGPRSARDAVADVMLMNLAMWTLAGFAAGTGASFQTIVIAESVEVVADVTVTRQFDDVATKIRLRDYEAAREAYLAQRRTRCAKPAMAPAE
jgi:phospholipid-binding lipoprotein MlaA